MKTLSASTFLQHAILFIFVCICQARYYEIGPGSPCGRPYGSRRWMIVEDQFLCEKCAAGEYWGRRRRTCLQCEGTFTNSKPNIRTSCKDPRISHQIDETTTVEVTLEQSTGSTHFENATTPVIPSETFTKANTLQEPNSTIASVEIRVSAMKVPENELKQTSAHNDVATSVAIMAQPLDEKPLDGARRKKKPRHYQRHKSKSRNEKKKDKVRRRKKAKGRRKKGPRKSRRRKLGRKNSVASSVVRI